MAGSIRFKNLRDEQHTFLTRILVAALFIVMLSGLLVWRLVHLQVVSYSHFSELSQGNRIRIEPMPPTRGLIYDRNGHVLAENVPTYRLEMIPEQVDDVRDTLERLAHLGLLERDEIGRLKELVRRHRRFEPVTLGFRMTEDQVGTFAVNRQHFPGVDIRARLRRHYPFGELTAHTIGYVGGISSTDFERLDRANYAGSSQVGRSGIERRYEETLHGTVGYRQVVVNARGRVLEQLDPTAADAEPARPGGEGRRRSREPVPGDDLVTSLDIRLQQAAAEALEGWRAAAVVIEPRSGDVLAMVSTPSFDPNLFSGGLSRAQYQGLLNDPANPLLNRTLRGIYPPGSTIKPHLGLALLHHDIVDPNRRIFCRGHFSLPNSRHRFRDWLRQGHGHVDLKQGIAQSCDVYFYTTAVELGINRMHEFLVAMGLGQPTGIDILGERAGLVPSPEWKRQAFTRREDQVWFPGETVIAGIGQGYMTATPLQLAHSTGVIAARGLRSRPRLVIGSGNGTNGESVDFDPEALSRLVLEDPHAWETIVDTMVEVTRGPRGTSRLSMQGTGYTVAGKTGTAQVFTVGQDEEYVEDEVHELLRDHALYVAFAPAENPEITLAVVVENGGSGSRTAAPIARAIMDRWFEAREQ